MDQVPSASISGSLTDLLCGPRRFPPHFTGPRFPQESFPLFLCGGCEMIKETVFAELLKDV